MAVEPFEAMCPDCVGKKEVDGKPCESCEGTGTVTVRMAATERTEVYWPEIERLMTHVCELTGIVEPLVTDLVDLGCFLDVLEDEEATVAVAELSNRLGVPVKSDDLIVDIARRMRERENSLHDDSSNLA